MRSDAAPSGPERARRFRQRAFLFVPLVLAGLAFAKGGWVHYRDRQALALWEAYEKAPLCREVGFKAGIDASCRDWVPAEISGFAAIDRKSASTSFRSVSLTTPQGERFCEVTPEVYERLHVFDRTGKALNAELWGDRITRLQFNGQVVTTRNFPGKPDPGGSYAYLVFGLVWSGFAVGAWGMRQVAGRWSARRSGGNGRSV